MTLLGRVGAAALLFLLATPTQAQENKGEANFTLDTSRTSKEVKLGEKGTLSIVIVPAAGKKVHDQAPLSVAVKAPTGLSYVKSKLGHADVVNPGDRSPELKAEFIAKEPGTQQTDADLQFFVCTDKWCERQQARISVSVTVH
jgi:hypothetical protein